MHTCDSACLLLRIIVVGSAFCLAPLSARGTDIPFQRVVIDPTLYGDVKMVGDINGDGFTDIALGGPTGTGLDWYSYPNWNRTLIATPSNEFTTDGRIIDVDGDGKPDIVVPDGDGSGNIKWFKNPGGAAASVGSNWQEFTIGTTGGWAHDVQIGDFDGDGRLDVATRSPSQDMIFFQTGSNSWTQTVFSNTTPGYSGLGMGDILGNGRQDLIVQGAWLQNPGGMAARTASNWVQHSIGSFDSEFKAVVTDLNHDGKPDIVTCSSDGTADVKWWTPTGSNPAGTWTGTTLIPSLQYCHTLQAADMDRDGTIDLVLGQMDTSTGKQIIILRNIGGKGTNWVEQIVDTTGIHNGVVADIGNDGRMDIIGCNYTGGPLYLWRNLMPLPGDFNNDGKVDDADYTVWADFYGKNPQTNGHPGYQLGSNPNGGYNDADYTIWADNYGESYPVPEPSVALLLVAGAVLILHTGKRGANRQARRRLPPGAGGMK